MMLEIIISMTRRRCPQRKTAFLPGSTLRALQRISSYLCGSSLPCIGEGEPDAAEISWGNHGVRAGLKSWVAAPHKQRQTHHEKVLLARAAMTLNLARSSCRIIAKKKTFKGNPACLRRVATN